MADIVLATLNAKYIHAAFGLRYLLANLGELRPRAALLEFDINQRPLEIAEAILARSPRILGLGVYIWNVAPTAELVSALKRIQPDLLIILGGPEVSYESEKQPIVQMADYTITGEADLKFAEVCRGLLGECGVRSAERGMGDGPAAASPCQSQHPHLTPTLSPPTEGAEREKIDLPHQSRENKRLFSPFVPQGAKERPSASGGARPAHKIIPAEVPALDRLVPPYDLYTDDDIAHRVIYVEASRGCPFTCEFCLSSLDIPVRQFPLPALLANLDELLNRGVRQFKFVDRTFNLNLATSRALLEFFLDRYRPGLFAHFEMIPDRLPIALREIISRFPPGALQFEVGIQTFNPRVSQLISRRQDYDRLADNFSFLRRQTGVHVHADLIVGLPGESLESFGQGFDRLIALGPQEIQVGILKRLRGTPITRHDAEWEMVWHEQPPYEILRNKLLDFAALQRLRRFARYWDLIGNSGNFLTTTPLLWRETVSPFREFLRLCDWLHDTLGRRHGIALAQLGELLFRFLTGEKKLPADTVASAIWQDYQSGGRSDTPLFLRAHLPEMTTSRREGTRAKLPKRQGRHVESSRQG
jgi:radical SAM superfamily enzyme YgiQ (UPF0313 family)